MTYPTIAIIGAGKMGSSLIGGLLKEGHPADHIIASDPGAEHLARLQQNYHILTTQDNHRALQSADIVMFAVKPNVLDHVASELKEDVQLRKPLIISIAAGVREASLQTWLGEKVAIVRAMPNTPALVGCGATGLYANTFVTQAQRNVAESVMRAVGIVVWLSEERLLDTVTALSGSGPAYFFLMMEALEDAAVSLGLPSEAARLLTLQTALGAAKMALESEEPPSTLRKHVTSPGGTTEKAISVLEDHQVRELFKQAITAAKKRSEDIAEQYTKK